MPKLLVTLLLCLLTRVASAEEEEAPVPSPDKRWTYRVIDETPAIVRADSDKVVLKLADPGDSMALRSGSVVWAPDSRRVAFNYRGGARTYICAVYELAGGKWKALPEVVSEEAEAKVRPIIQRAEQRDRKRLGVAKSAYRRRIDDQWSVRRWINSDTFEVFVTSLGTVIVDKESEETAEIGGAVLFTAKCDNKGGWKITRLRELSDEEASEIENALAGD